MNLLALVLPRALGVLASLGAGWLFVHTKGALTLDPTQVVEITGTMIGAYAATHRGASSVVNKGDAATTRIATAENVASEYGSIVKVQPPSK